jgi:hypothetical protein
VWLLIALAGSATVSGQAIPLDQQIWTAEVIRPHGQPVIPLFDGWFPNEDGSSTLCYGYFNLNTEQSLDIPAGEFNSLSDTRYEALLPTHFEPLPPRYRRKFCVFTIRVPADFGRDETIVWTLTSNGQTISVPGHTLPAFVLDEPASDGRGDIAPLVRVERTGTGLRGRTGIHREETVSATVGTPVRLQAWIEHPDPTVWVGWSKHAGPGEVVFDFAESEVRLTGGPIGVLAYFEQAGEYIVRLQTIDDTDAFEFYCCHTNAFFRVRVAPATRADTSD